MRTLPQENKSKSRKHMREEARKLRAQLKESKRQRNRARSAAA